MFSFKLEECLSLSRHCGPSIWLIRKRSKTYFTCFVSWKFSSKLWSNRKIITAIAKLPTNRGVIDEIVKYGHTAQAIRVFLPKYLPRSLASAEQAAVRQPSLHADQESCLPVLVHSTGRPQTLISVAVAPGRVPPPAPSRGGFRVGGDGRWPPTPLRERKKGKIGKEGKCREKGQKWEKEKGQKEKKHKRGEKMWPTLSFSS